MNILPKKSWHVLSRSNIERVRRDEAEAKAQEEEKQRRAEIAEREARLALMRKRAHERDGYSDEDEPITRKERRVSPEASVATERGHINFFADIKQGVGMQTTNVDHDKEKKEEQEKYEKRIGLLNYLVDKDKSDDPWYSKSKVAKESAKSKRRKELMDPLNDMKRFVTQTKKHSTEQSTGVARNRVPLIAAAPSSSASHLSSRSNQVEQATGRSDRAEERKRSEGHEERQKEHKSKSKDKRKKKKEREREKEAHLEELRRQRRKREEAERAKAETLLRLHHSQDGGGSGQVGSSSQSVEDTAGRYNSQFNPHLVRQRYHQ